MGMHVGAAVCRAVALPAIFLLNVPCTERCPPQTVWALEYLEILRELRMTEKTKISLLSMLRFVRFNKLELTHVCCRRLTQDSWILRDNLLPEEDARETIAREEEIVN